jgi:exosome complex component CSL4
MTDENTDRFCTPGERLASVLDGTTQYRAGLGTFESGNYICSSLVGKVVEKTVQEDGDSYIVVHVVQEHPSPVLIPHVGDVVVCKVVRISQKHVFLDILQVRGKDVVEKFSGLIRNSDIRSSDIDALEVHRCFRPRDIVRAKVLSLGDARAYYLTTAEKGLGVVSCRSQTTGDLMIPLDETCMICKETQEKEERKACVQL